MMVFKRIINVRIFGVLVFGLVLLIAGCGRQVTPAILTETTQPAETSPVPSATPSFTVAPTHTPQPTATHTPIPSATATANLTPTPSETPSPTPSPTYTILRGEVLQRSNCRYGPGAPYLYKYGLVVGSNLEVIGRNDLGTWILVRAIGGDNPCWVKASLMDVKGDVMSVQPTYIPLPQSPYYDPPPHVWATREGDEVTVTWTAMSLRAGDETASPQYLLEAWVCQEGELVFIPVGVDINEAKVIDEAGCSEPSHGRVYLVEKHGYTNWMEVGWPPHD